ncbi:hypothetical protein PENTCL1PPCAC_14473, partial [Pristionchus entomophagus]
NRNLFCNTCYNMVFIVEEDMMLDDPNMKECCIKWCYEVYGQVHGNLAKECKKWIDDDLQKIVDMVISGQPADVICKDLQFC